MEALGKRHHLRQVSQAGLRLRHRSVALFASSQQSEAAVQVVVGRQRKRPRQIVNSVCVGILGNGKDTRALIEVQRLGVVSRQLIMHRDLSAHRIDLMGVANGQRLRDAADADAAAASG